MLDDFKSLWTIGGLQPLCKYSKPASLIMPFIQQSLQNKNKEKMTQALESDHVLRLLQFAAFPSNSTYLCYFLQPQKHANIIH